MARDTVPVRSKSSRGLPCPWAPLAFRQMRIEATFRDTYSRKHAALDPLGFAFALAWCAAAAYRLGCTLTAAQHAALILLAAGSAAAAALQQLAPTAYLRHRNTILCVLRLSLAAAAAVAAQLTALHSRQCGGNVAAFVVLQGGQHLLVAFCAFAWRLRLQLHLPLQGACLAAVAAANCRLAAAITAEPAMAAAVAGVMQAVSPALAAALSPATAVAAVATILQVQLGFHVPSSLLVAAEARERAAFLPSFLMQTAISYQSGGLRLGRRQSVRPAATHLSPELEARLATLGQVHAGKPHERQEE